MILDIDALCEVIAKLSDAAKQAGECETPAEALKVGALLAKLGEEVLDVAACIEEDAIEAEENAEEWEPDYDDDFPMYLEYENWEEDSHSSLDIERDF